MKDILDNNMKLSEWHEFNQPLLDGIDAVFDHVELHKDRKYIKVAIPYANAYSDLDMKSEPCAEIEGITELWYDLFNISSRGRYTTIIRTLGAKEVFQAMAVLLVQFTKAAANSKEWLDANPYMVKHKMMELTPKIRAMIRYRYADGELDDLIELMKRHHKVLVKLLK